MARKNQAAATDATSQATNQALANQAATNPSSTNVKMVKLIADLSPDAAGNVRKAGDLMPRKDFVRHRWQVDFVDRGQITKDLTAMNTIENGGDGKKIPYQVVFAVLKKGAESYGGPTQKPGAEGQVQQTEGQTA